VAAVPSVAAIIAWTAAALRCYPLFMGATLEATQRYARRMKGTTGNGHFREQQGLLMSSIGLGTYLGEADAETDQQYRHAIGRAVELGVNVLDTAINYRFQRSERAIGCALRDLEANGRARRDEIILASKAGYLSFDGAYPPNPREYFLETFINPGILGPRDIVAGSHCMTPRYLAHQIDQTLRNLGVHVLDIFYLHNPETQLSEISREEFHKRLRVAFGFLEGVVRSGKIRMYGLATWNGLRVQPESSEFISIEQTVGCARDVAGNDHHFTVIQLPYNLAMPEAYTLLNQRLNGRLVSVFDACRELGLTVMTSASIFQSRLSRNLPPFVADYFTGFATDAQRAIQFARSTPGVTTALVGMSHVSHVEENLGTAAVPPSADSVRSMFDAA
jgi:aryl-alcohol dehydrogenase-like predicted oxidoreductase